MVAASGEVGEVPGLDLRLLLPPFLPLSLWIWPSFAFSSSSSSCV
jgi:hypothetical protein